jgi:hypothetical protein
LPLAIIPQELSNEFIQSSFLALMAGAGKSVWPVLRDEFEKTMMTGLREIPQSDGGTGSRQLPSK